MQKSRSRFEKITVQCYLIKISRVVTTSHIPIREGVVIVSSFTAVASVARDVDVTIVMLSFLRRGAGPAFEGSRRGYGSSEYQTTS